MNAVWNALCHSGAPGFLARRCFCSAVCGILAFLQYRWIGEVANAEQQRLQQDLQRNLNFVRRDFNPNCFGIERALALRERY
jgi:hypothetical protein